MAYKPAYIWNGTSFDAIGNQAVSNLNDYALLAPAGSQTITNTSLTSPTITGTAVNSGTISGGTIDNPFLVSPSEKITVSATAATGTVNFDIVTQGVMYYTTNASANWTLNVRGNSGTTLNAAMVTGESLSILFLVTQGATPYYQSAMTVDGVSVTPKWSGGSAPTSGNANSIDAYSMTIVKTGTSAYTVFAAQGKYA